MPPPQSSPLQPTPLLLQAGAPAVLANRASFTPDRRPYLVTIQDRKAGRSAQRYPALFPHEPEDARLTGATRSLYRRLLALNLPGRVISPLATSAIANEVAKPTFASFKMLASRSPESPGISELSTQVHG
jgi:hypothetical protein